MNDALYLNGFAGVLASLTGDNCSFPGVETVVREGNLRLHSPPAARYAITACRRLPEFPLDCPIVCFSGATGISASWFDSAHQVSDAYGLVGTNFARAGHRRIHPLTLLLLLQNQ